jgi:hypothetical protein
MKDHPFIISIKALEKKLDEFVRTFGNRKLMESGDVVLDNADFIQLFKISPKTAQSWREEGLITYSQIKNKFYYRLQDIREMLDNHRYN